MKASIMLAFALAVPSAEPSSNKAESMLRSALTRNCPHGCSCAPCPIGDCECGCECSAVHTVVQPKDLPAAFLNNFKHDCGCGSLPCNCFGPGGCHCREHRAENRQNLRWTNNGGTTQLYRGRRLIGALNSKGTYYPYDDATDRWLEPTKPPIPVPDPTSLRPVQRRTASC